MKSYAQEITENALRSTLLRQLRRRFGELPPATVRTIETTEDIDRLDAWLDRVVTTSVGKHEPPALKPEIEGIPFNGGLVGTTGYDVVRFFEKLPGNRAELRARGLTPADLAVEVQRGRAAGIRNLLAGIELVEMTDAACCGAGVIGGGVAATDMDPPAARLPSAPRQCQSD